MNYELAKQLRANGFPQDGDGVGSWVCQHTERLCLDDFVDGDDCDLCYAPTLEELIEACGTEFRSIVNTGVSTDVEFLLEWVASSFTSESCTASNPTEAVALLWLALNKK